MSDRSRLASYLELHAATLVLGIAGPIGKAVVLYVPALISARALVALPLLALIIHYRGGRVDAGERGSRWLVFLTGLLLACHWMTFFQAMRVSTVAVGIVTTFTFPVITALLEPLFFRERFRWFTGVNAVLVVVGMLLVTGELSLESENTRGALWGLLSAVAFASRNMLSRRLGNQYRGEKLMFMQLVVVAIVLSPFLFIGNWGEMGAIDWSGLLVLGLLCTAIGHSLFVAAIGIFGAATASIVTSMQPIYGTIIAIFWPGEIPSPWTVVGGLVILAAVFHQSVQLSGAQPFRFISQRLPWSS